MTRRIPFLANACQAGNIPCRGQLVPRLTLGPALRVIKSGYNYPDAASLTLVSRRFLRITLPGLPVIADRSLEVTG